VRSSDPRRPPTRHLIAVLATALVASACSPSAPDEPATGEELSIAVASFDVSVGQDRRLLAAVFTPDRRLLGGGTVLFQLGHLGEVPGGEADLTQQVEATYLPVPGAPSASDAPSPEPLDDPTLSGVYAGRVSLDRPGYWGLRVVVEGADGTVSQGRTVFLVLEEGEVVDVGDPAPRTINLTSDDVVAGRGEARALDSRMQEPGASDPAPTLHATTVAAAMDAGRPVVVIIATPVYCQSRVCGPLTETLVAVAERHAERATFVHIEVWGDFEEQRLNDAAAEWIQTASGGNEPWVFLVGADGRIAARWDNVLDLAELERLLAALPATGAGG